MVPEGPPLVNVALRMPTIMKLARASPAWRALPQDQQTAEALAAATQALIGEAHAETTAMLLPEKKKLRLMAILLFRRDTIMRDEFRK
uniref:NR LBD domain-containing protein n=1 Tax=Globodera pallida TaxID=36090 RepID=A0A183BZU3_GLOPA